jgi:hypothetical protein
MVTLRLRCRQIAEENVSHTSKEGDYRLSFTRRFTMASAPTQQCAIAL